MIQVQQSNQAISVPNNVASVLPKGFTRIRNHLLSLQFPSATKSCSEHCRNLFILSGTGRNHCHVSIMSHVPWKNGVACDIYKEQTKCFTVCKVQGEREPSEPVLRTKAGNHPLLCTQGVKVTFHNTSETGLMEGLVHGFCWVGKKRAWKSV